MYLPNHVAVGRNGRGCLPDRVSHHAPTRALERNIYCRSRLRFDLPELHRDWVGRWVALPPCHPRRRDRQDPGHAGPW